MRVGAKPAPAKEGPCPRSRSFRSHAPRRGARALSPNGARRLRKRTQMENASGFNATVIKGVYARADRGSRGSRAWQNQARNINDSNAMLILAPPADVWPANVLISHVS